MSNKTCLFCNAILKGRADKKFCDSFCRAAYHNTNRASHEILMTNINKSLRKNRKILSFLCPNGKATVRKDVLDKLGYKYEYFTGTFKTKFGTYYFAYDYGMLPIIQKNVKKVVVVNRQSYMNSFDVNLWD